MGPAKNGLYQEEEFSLGWRRANFERVCSHWVCMNLSPPRVTFLLAKNLESFNQEPFPRSLEIPQVVFGSNRLLELIRNQGLKNFVRLWVAKSEDGSKQVVYILLSVNEVSDFFIWIADGRKIWNRNRHQLIKSDPYSTFYRPLLIKLLYLIGLEMTLNSSEI